MKRKLYNSQGSALVWVLVICVIFGLLGVALGSIALSMNNRSVNNNSRQQAYFTARSSLDTVFAYLNADMSYPFTTYLYGNLINGSHSIKIDNIFDDPRITKDNTLVEGMGECSVEGTFKDGIVTLMASARVATQEQKITMTAKRNQEGAIWPAEAWGIPLKESGQEILKVGSKNDRQVSNGEDALVNFSVYIVKKTNPDVLKGKLDIVSDSQNNATQAIFIYVMEGASLEITGIQGWDKNYGPDIFIYLSKEAKLILQPMSTEKYPFYISAMTGAQISLSETLGKAEVFFVNGAKEGLDKNITFVEKDRLPERIPRSNYYYSADSFDPTNGAKSNKWNVIKYEESK